jgi:rRNA processing protein Gar1
MFIILTTQSDGLKLSDLGISSLFHNIFLLRYVEAGYRMKRSLLILKMRATHHDQSILEFVITDNGMKILGILDNYGDILKDVVQPYKEVQKKEEITLQEEEMKRRIAEYKAREMEIRNRENREQNKRKRELEKNLNNIHKNNVGNE